MHNLEESTNFAEKLKPNKVSRLVSLIISDHWIKLNNWYITLLDNHSIVEQKPPRRYYRLKKKKRFNYFTWGKIAFAAVPAYSTAARRKICTGTRDKSAKSRPPRVRRFSKWTLLASRAHAEIYLTRERGESRARMEIQYPQKFSPRRRDRTRKCRWRNENLTRLHFRCPGHSIPYCLAEIREIRGTTDSA